jgi:hypothetical protein
MQHTVRSTQCIVRSAQCAARREMPKRVLKKSKGGNGRKKGFYPSTFWQKVFDMCFFQKVFVVFLNSPC